MRNAECGMRNRRRTPASGTDRGNDDSHELAGFVSQGRYTLDVTEPPFCDEVKPELGLVGLFLDDAQLRQELLARSRATSGAIVCPNRRPSTQQLTADHIGTPPAWQIVDQANHCEREGSGAILQIDLRHDLTLLFRIPHSEFRIQRFRCFTSAHCSRARRKFSGVRSAATSASTSSTSARVAPVFSDPRRWECSCCPVPRTAIAATVHSSRRFKSSPGRPITFPYASTSTRSSSAGCSARRLRSSLW